MNVYHPPLHGFPFRQNHDFGEKDLCMCFFLCIFAALLTWDYAYYSA